MSKNVSFLNFLGSRLPTHSPEDGRNVTPGQRGAGGGLSNASCPCSDSSVIFSIFINVSPFLLADDLSAFLQQILIIIPFFAYHYH